MAITTEIYRDFVINGFVEGAAPLYETFCLDAKPEPAERGKIVKATFIPSGSAPVAFNGSFSMVGAPRQDVNVTLDQYYYASDTLTTAQILESSLVSLEQAASITAQGMVNYVFMDHLNYISSSGQFTTTASFSSASAINYDALIDVRESARTNLKWSGKAYAFVNGKVFKALLKDDDLSFNSRGSADVRTRGDMGNVLYNVAGFTAVYEVPGIPFTNNTVGYAVTPQALVSAMRWWKGDDGLGLRTNVPVNLAQVEPADKRSGITLGYREWGSPDTDSVKAAFTALWGKIVGDPKAALLLKATVNS